MRLDVRPSLYCQKAKKYQVFPTFTLMQSKWTQSLKMLIENPANPEEAPHHSAYAWPLDPMNSVRPSSAFSECYRALIIIVGISQGDADKSSDLTTQAGGEQVQLITKVFSSGVPPHGTDQTTSLWTALCEQGHSHARTGMSLPHAESI